MKEVLFVDSMIVQGNWRHISLYWNFEVCPELSEPRFIGPIPAACSEVKNNGWLGYFRTDTVDFQPPDRHALLANVRVWHYSSHSETSPYEYLHCSDAHDVYTRLLSAFQIRDPGGIVATALSEWHEVFNVVVAHCPMSETERMRAYVRERERT